MSISDVFKRAHAVLAVDHSADQQAIKRAYRQQVVLHAPDRDPDGFRRIRDGYELLMAPETRARELLRSPLPAIDPPELDDPPVVRGATALAVLRAVVGTIDSARLLADPEPITPPASIARPASIAQPASIAHPASIAQPASAIADPRSTHDAPLTASVTDAGSTS